MDDDHFEEHPICPFLLSLGLEDHSVRGADVFIFRAGAPRFADVKARAQGVWGSGWSRRGDQVSRSLGSLELMRKKHFSESHWCPLELPLTKKA